MYIKFAFFMVGRVLVRFLQVAKEKNNELLAFSLRTELEYIRYFLLSLDFVVWF